MLNAFDPSEYDNPEEAALALAFLDQLLHDPASLPPPELDPALAKTLKRLAEAQRRAPTLSRKTKDKLWKAAQMNVQHHKPMVQPQLYQRNGRHPEMLQTKLTAPKQALEHVPAHSSIRRHIAAPRQNWRPIRGAATLAATAIFAGALAFMAFNRDRQPLSMGAAVTATAIRVELTPTFVGPSSVVLTATLVGPTPTWIPSNATVVIPVVVGPSSRAGVIQGALSSSGIKAYGFVSSADGILVVIAKSDTFAINAGIMATCPGSDGRQTGGYGGPERGSSGEIKTWSLEICKGSEVQVSIASMSGEERGDFEVSMTLFPFAVDDGTGDAFLMPMAIIPDESGKLFTDMTPIAPPVDENQASGFVVTQRASGELTDETSAHTYQLSSPTKGLLIFMLQAASADVKADITISCPDPAANINTVIKAEGNAAKPKLLDVPVCAMGSIDIAISGAKGSYSLLVNGISGSISSMIEPPTFSPTSVPLPTQTATIVP
jgi:hypothetical protein